MELPQIRIKDAWLLRENASVHLHKLWAKEGEELADFDAMQKIVAAYQAAWEPVEKKILTAMTDSLGLEFRKNIIDVSIAPWFRAFSDPLVIGVTYEPDMFVDILTHELIHVLLTDSTKTPEDLFVLGADWGRMYGDKHTFGALVHIPVHAVHKHIYLDILKDPAKYDRDKHMSDGKAKDYIDAWAYVDAHDYKKLITELKESYTRYN